MTLPASWKRGLWDLVAERSQGDRTATAPQLKAARYLIQNMPAEAMLGFDAATELLTARSYVVGLLVVLEKEGVKPHPREAMWWALRELYLNPPMLKAIKKWNRDRYMAERGPARVGSTSYVAELGGVVKWFCKERRPTEGECLKVRNAVLRLNGLGPLVDASAPTITYDDGFEISLRKISNLRLESAWPYWAALLIDPTTFLTINAYCHLRRDERSFASIRITKATS